MHLPKINSSNRNVALYYLHIFLNSLWFFEGVWYFFMGSLLAMKQLELFSVLPRSSGFSLKFLLVFLLTGLEGNNQ